MIIVAMFSLNLILDSMALRSTSILWRRKEFPLVAVATSCIKSTSSVRQPLYLSAVLSGQSLKFNQTIPFTSIGFRGEKSKENRHQTSAALAAVAGISLASSSQNTSAESDIKLSLNENNKPPQITSSSFESDTTEVSEGSDNQLKMPFPEDCVKLDTYNGVTLEVSTLPQELISDTQIFAIHLNNAISFWKSEGKRGIWLKISTQFAHLIPVSCLKNMLLFIMRFIHLREYGPFAPTQAATKVGFDFQYAEKGRVILTAWLPEDTESRLPHGPTHQIGIGALVLHPITGRMLVVQEKRGPAAARKLWKMPTGLADPGEDVTDAAVREVKEETGLDVEFDHVVCIRQAHAGHEAFNKSDMFFVCQLRLSPKYSNDLKSGIEIELKPQEEEIADAKWVDMEEFFKQPLWTSSPLYNEMNAALKEAARKLHPSLGTDSKSYDTVEYNQEVVGFVGKKLPVGFRPGSNVIFVVNNTKSRL